MPASGLDRPGRVMHTDRVRAWIELPPDLGWGGTAVMKSSLARDGYAVEEIRGAVHMLRLSGSRLGSWEALKMPGEG